MAIGRGLACGEPWPYAQERRYFGTKRPLEANVGATRANDFPARRTSADKRLAIMPGGELIQTTLNAIQVTPDQKAGGFESLRARP